MTTRYHGASDQISLTDVACHAALQGMLAFIDTDAEHADGRTSKLTSELGCGTADRVYRVYIGQFSVGFAQVCNPVEQWQYESYAQVCDGSSTHTMTCRQGKEEAATAAAQHPAQKLASSSDSQLLQQCLAACGNAAALSDAPAAAFSAAMADTASTPVRSSAAAAAAAATTLFGCASSSLRCNRHSIYASALKRSSSSGSSSVSPLPNTWL